MFLKVRGTFPPGYAPVGVASTRDNSVAQFRGKTTDLATLLLSQRHAAAGARRADAHVNPEARADFYLHQTKALGSVACVCNVIRVKRNWRLSLKMLPNKVLAEERYRAREYNRMY